MSETPPPIEHVEEPVQKKTLLDVASGRLAEVRELLDLSKGGLSADDVHDLRVATRRLEEVVGIFGAMMDGGMAQAVADSLKGLRKAAGDLRDLDVLVEHLERAHLPAALRHVAQGVIEAAPERRKALETALLATCASASVSGAMVFLARVIEERSVEMVREQTLLALDEAVNKRLKKRRRQMQKALGKAAMKQTAAALHAARIAIKKVRYVLELLPGKGRELKMLKGMQGLLGEHHDVHVIEETIESHLPAPAPVGLRPAWGKYRRKVAREQAGRAGKFFVMSYQWNAR